MITAAEIDELMAQEVLELRKNIVTGSTSLLRVDVLNNHFIAKVDFSIIDKLFKLSGVMETNATQLEGDAKQDNKPQIKKEIIELEAKK
jgi:hypothetical protein